MTPDTLHTNKERLEKIEALVGKCLSSNFGATTPEERLAIDDLRALALEAQSASEGLAVYLNRKGMLHSII